MLLCRIGEQVYASVIGQENVIPMEFTGKPMKGYIYVSEDGFSNARDLHRWLQLCLDFNPMAKSSKKK